ncbi:protein MRVI1 isoform X1 [Silurus asotus]|uniref:Protein MRVI1 isoform X1 n=1 Tax=Silurus asotus TaxID=30991 RepID=A0AAD5A2I0_SILAS|nr:protein MRVI1 isoform X1 [Silurus asotus]
MNGFSEEELLNITFEECDASGQGEVLASTVVQFLQAMTGHSSAQEKLVVLKHMLDPEDRDLPIDRDVFHTTMRKWISQCSQDGAQLRAGIARCLAEELEEARRESQEGTSQAQAYSQSLIKEIEHLKTRVKVIEEMVHCVIYLSNIDLKQSCGNFITFFLQNEKLLLERNIADDRINNLKGANTYVREELDELQMLLAVKEREITKKTCVEENNSSVPEPQPPSSSKTDLYNFIHKIKSAELQDAYRDESLPKAFLQDQKEQTSSKQLLTILREIERPWFPWDQQPKRRQIETHRKRQELRKAPPITWWRALRVEDERNWNTSDIHGTTKERLGSLESQLKDAQIEVQNSRTELREARVQVERADVGVQTEQVGDERKCVAAEKVLESLRMVEVVVMKALQTAEVLTESERRTKERMEAISLKVEEALSRTTDAENQLRGLEAQVSSCAKQQKVMLVPDCLDYLPVGLVNKQNPPEGNCSERGSTVAHDPVPETSQSVACEERRRHGTQENGVGSKEPDDKDDFLIKSGERKNIGVSLEEVVYNKTLKLEEKEYPNRKPDNTGRRENLETSASSESGQNTKCEVFESVRRGDSSERKKCDQIFRTRKFILREVASESNRSWKEESGTSTGSKEVTNGNVKDLSTNCSTSESGKRQGSDVYEGRSVQICQEQTAQLVGTLKKEISAECEEAGSPANPAASSKSLKSHTPSFFPRTHSRPPTTPTMPTVPEEEEDSPEEIDSTSSSPSSVMPVESKLVNVTLLPPAIVLPRQVNKQEPRPLKEARPHSPRPRLARNSSSSGPITTVDNDGYVIDLVKDELPEMQLSDEDRQKNLELLEEAKKVSDRFLTRRGRRSTCSLTESPTALSPNPTPGSSPVPSRSSSFSTPAQIEVLANPPSSPSTSQRLEVPAVRDHGEANKPEQETLVKLVEWKSPEKRKVSSGTLTPRHTASVPAKELIISTEQCASMDRGKKPTSDPAVQKPDSQAPATGVAKPVPRLAMQQAPCTAEIKTIGAFPPLMRAVSWDTVGSLNMRNGGPKGEDSFSYSDSLKPPVNPQKLSKLREEHKLLRNQSISGSKLPDLSETAEQDRGAAYNPSSSTTESPGDGETKERADAMPNISDLMLRKLKLHRGLPGCAPPLTEKEVENAFVQLSLAFRNDNYTLDTRLKQAERERNLTEENAEKELEDFKASLKSTVSLWQNADQREFYQRLIETVAVLHRLANRLSSRAEMVGAVRQEKRMNKATEVMLQYVENLKRTYEKDHAELLEFKKLANQNSNRCYGGSIETGDDGVPRSARSLSISMGKALPRRRVSVAVVPKFNLLNIPGQTPGTGGPASVSGVSLSAAAGSPSSGPGALPVLCEANSMKSESTSDPAQQAAGENGKVLLEQEGEAATLAKVSYSPEEIRAEIKAKIEEEAYNKGYQEGLKRLKELKEVKEEEEKAEEKDSEPEDRTGEEQEEKENPSRSERVLEILERVCPKIFRSNWTLWVVLTLFLVVFLLVNFINFFNNLYADHADPTAEKSNVPAKEKFLGLHVGSKNPSSE